MDIKTAQILSLVKNFCRPRVVEGLMSDLRQADVIERRLIRDTRESRAKGDDVSLSDQDKLDRLITLCQSKLSTEELCQLLLGIGDVFKLHGEMIRAEEIYTMVLGHAEQSGKKGYVAEAYMRRGEIYSRKGQWKQSTTDLSRSRVLFSELKHHEALGRVENILGTNYAEQGKTRKAVEAFEHALQLFERTRQSEMAGTALMNMGIINNIIGDYDSALTHYKRAQSAFEGIGDLNRLAELHHNLGMSYLSKGLFNEGIREFNQSHTLSSRLQNVSLMGLANLGRANAYYYLKDLTMALKLVSQAIESFTRSSDRLGLADAYKVKGMIHRATRRYAFAESYLQTSLRINIEFNNNLNIGETCFEIGLLEQKRGRRKEALAAFERAQVSFKKVGALREAARAEQAMHSVKE